jgi:hypothetical protein
MMPVLLCGSPDETSVREALLPALSRYGGVFFVGRGCVVQSGSPAGYLLCESSEIPDIVLPHGILVIKDKIVQIKPASIPDNFLCVMASHNKSGAKLLHDCRVTAVSCGTDPKDTLSLAGLESSCADVSLQRNLVTAGGNMQEPRDFHVEFSKPRSPEQILLVSAVLLLSDIDPENGYVI